MTRLVYFECCILLERQICDVPLDDSRRCLEHVPKLFEQRCGSIVCVDVVYTFGVELVDLGHPEKQSHARRLDVVERQFLLCGLHTVYQLNTD